MDSMDGNPQAGRGEEPRIVLQDRSSLRILITGGTGTLGHALTDVLLKQGNELTIISRDPHKQAKYKARYPQVRTILTDICNAPQVYRACQGQDIVIHACALKRVDTGEYAVDEFHRVNVLGTQVVADAARDASIERCLFISTDKSVSPLNHYGMTKAIAERLWLARNETGTFLQTMFSAVRYGNVMGSNGSVIPIWREQAERGDRITVRYPETTRFFMQPASAVKLVIDAINNMQGGEIFVPANTPAFALYDLAECFQERSEWHMEPLGAHEKQHEALVAPGEYHEPAFTGAWRVWPDMAVDNFTVDKMFCSKTAHRISGQEVIDRLA